MPPIALATLSPGHQRKPFMTHSNAREIRAWVFIMRSLTHVERDRQGEAATQHRRRLPPRRRRLSIALALSIGCLDR